MRTDPSGPGEPARAARAAKRVVICADDFGWGPAVNAGILSLVDLGRLTAVSCDVEAPAFAAGAAALRARDGSVELGLHLDLAPHRAGLLALLARSAARVVDRRAVKRRIEAQLDAFEQATGRPPDFVDGHQHVHQLPAVRDTLLDVLAVRHGPSLPWVRNTVPRRPRGPKSVVIAALGGVQLRRELRRRGVRHNADFAGVYDFDPRAAYQALARRWLADLSDRGLLLCHPGTAPGDPRDPIAAARSAERAYLGSPAFESDCAAAGVALVRFDALS